MVTLCSLGIGMLIGGYIGVSFYEWFKEKEYYWHYKEHA